MLQIILNILNVGQGSKMGLSWETVPEMNFYQREGICWNTLQLYFRNEQDMGKKNCLLKISGDRQFCMRQLGTWIGRWLVVFSHISFTAHTIGDWGCQPIGFICLVICIRCHANIRNPVYRYLNKANTYFNRRTYN